MYIRQIERSLGLSIILYVLKFHGL